MLWGGQSSFEQVGSAMYLNVVVRVLGVLGVARGLAEAAGRRIVLVRSGWLLRRVGVRGSGCMCGGF